MVRPSALIATSSQKPMCLMLPVLAVCLNQAYVVLGVNTSLADCVLVATLLYLTLTNHLQIPCVPTAFFLCLSATMLCSSVYYVPAKFNFAPGTLSLITEYAKLTVLFSYFVLGYNAAQATLTHRTVKAYSSAAMAIGMVGLISVLLKSAPLFAWVCPDGLRLQGLMNDPNYFSIIQVSALPYFTRTNNLTSVQKYIGCTILLLSILFSGSKTGTLTLMLYFVWRSMAALKQVSTSTVYVVVAILVALVLLSFAGALPFILNRIAVAIPATERIRYMFDDFSSAISTGGSDRSATWSVALEIIRSSPLLGVGAATYIGVAKEMFGDVVGATVVAHSTYLQIFAEWGGVWASLFLADVLYLATFCAGTSETSKMVRDILIVLLIGSLGISLNNARVFWFFLGILSCSGRGRLGHLPHREPFRQPIVDRMG